MSTLISSFLIDPIVRTARHLSRSESNPERSAPRPIRLPRSSSQAPDAIDGEDASMVDERVEDRLTASSSSPEPTLQRQNESEALYHSPDTDSTFEGPDFTSNNPQYDTVEISESHLVSLSYAANNDLDGNGAGSLSGLGVNSSEDTQTSSQELGEGGPRIIPPDDGMSLLRRRIVDIRDTQLPVSEKARRIHNIMTEGYISSHAHDQSCHPPRPHSPASLRSQEPPLTPTSLKSNGQTQYPPTPNSILSPHEPLDSYNLTHEDLEPTYFSNRERTNSTHSASSSQSNLSDMDDNGPLFGCRHYMRNVKLQCSSCNRWYTCRLCHDEVEDHVLKRNETKNINVENKGHGIIAMCASYGTMTARRVYIIATIVVSVVWTCCVCMSISIEKTHRCIVENTKCNCPICGEYMFTSQSPVVFMKCGHSIHQQCFFDYAKTNYRCPTCLKSIVNMDLQFRDLERSIQRQPMPPEYQDTKAVVYCNDCCSKSAVKFHWLGLKCDVCESYNTVKLRLMKGTECTDALIAATQVPSQNSQRRLPEPSTAGPSVPDGHEIPFLTAAAAGTEDVRLTRGLPEVGPLAIHPETINPFEEAIGITQGVDRSMDENDDDDDDDDDVNFWGGESPKSPTSPTEDSQDESEDEESDSDMEDVPEEDSEVDDDEDEMEIFGHI
ncbi:MAG: hypothetical protein M1834_009125 [Cirrosporium novae-zelandiae]|nr:MAG: hypothetical protein M1834_009125 [Cirrosporium novae-zelandiae]